MRKQPAAAVLHLLYNSLRSYGYVTIIQFLIKINCLQMSVTNNQKN